MELLHALTGTIETVVPKDRHTTKAIRKLLGDLPESHLEVVSVGDRQCLAYDMYGHSAKHKPLNLAATRILHSTHKTDVRVYGNAIVFRSTSINGAKK